MTTFTISQSEYHDLREEYGGICLACGETQYGGVEPDARNYPCENCGKKKVFGIEEALFMGCIEFGSTTPLRDALDARDAEDSDFED